MPSASACGSHVNGAMTSAGERRVDVVGVRREVAHRVRVRRVAVEDRAPGGHELLAEVPEVVAAGGVQQHRHEHERQDREQQHVAELRRRSHERQARSSLRELHAAGIGVGRPPA